MCAACTTTFCHGGALMPYGGNDWLALTQEPTLEPELPICDPHHHFWDRRLQSLPYQRYLLDELNADISSGHNVRSTVFLEARSMYRPDGPVEMRPVREGAKVLSQKGLSLDIMISFPQMPEVADFARAVPELPIILNHIGALNRVGLYANREDEVKAAWRAGIAAVAACPNITLKLGGLGMPRMGFDWHTRAVPIGSEALAADMSPWMQYCIEHFGPERGMFESKFPPAQDSF